MSRILFLLSCYPGVGGIEKVTNYLANEFCKVHHVVIASQMRIENKPMLDALDKRVKFFKLPDEKNPLAKENVAIVNAIIEEENINRIIYQDSYSPFFRILGLINSNPCKKLKVIVVEHNAPMCFLSNYIDYIRSLKFNTFRNSMKKLLCPYKILKIYLSISKQHQYTYNHCDYYILLSEAFKKEFSKLNFFRTSKIIAISNPLTIEKFPVNENKENNLLFIGSINLRKGIDYLMRIWEEIEHNTTVWNLLILGQGEDLSYVTKYIADHQLKHIKLLGYQSNIIPYLQESKCLLMTSRYEGFPLVLPETMAYGCVPFAFKSFAAVNDILTSDTGILIKPFDCEEYSKELMDLINDTERWHSMSKNCIQRARTVFSMDKILAQWEKVLN